MQWNPANLAMPFDIHRAKGGMNPLIVSPVKTYRLVDRSKGPSPFDFGLKHLVSLREMYRTEKLKISLENAETGEETHPIKTHRWPGFQITTQPDSGRQVRCRCELVMAFRYSPPTINLLLQLATRNRNEWTKN